MFLGIGLTQLPLKKNSSFYSKKNVTKSIDIKTVTAQVDKSNVTIDNKKLSLAFRGARVVPTLVENFRKAHLLIEKSQKLDGSSRFNNSEKSSILKTALEILKQHKFKPEQQEQCLEDLKQLMNAKEPNSNCLLNANSIVKTWEDHEFGYPIISEFVLKHKKLSELNMEQKKELIEWSNWHYDGQKILSKILSFNKDDFIAKITKSIYKSVKVNPLSKEVKAAFDRSISGIDKNIENVDFDKLGNLKLKHNKQNFINTVEESLKGLSAYKRRMAFNYYGFNIENGVVSGYPVVLEKVSAKKQAKINFLSEEKRIALESAINKFTIENEIVLPEHPQFQKDLNNIIKAFPELIPNFSEIDLRILQKVVKNKHYQTLPEEEKEIAKKVALFYDINERDLHPILSKPGLPKRNSDRIINLVKNKDWLNKLSNGEKIEKIAFMFRTPGDFKIAQIFADTDLPAVNKINSIQSLVDQIHQTSIWLPTTKLPQEHTIIKLSEQRDFKGIIHSFYSSSKKLDIFNFTSFEGNDGVFSTSYVTRNNFTTCYKYGLLFEVKPSNIALAFNDNMTSGKGKTEKTYIQLLFNERAKPYRQHFSDQLKKKLKEHGITEDYAKIMEKLDNCQSLEDINLEGIDNEKLKVAISETIEESLLNKNGKHNELVVNAPKSIGLFAKAKSEAEIPENMKKYAEEHKLPILLVDI